MTSMMDGRWRDERALLLEATATADPHWLEPGWPGVGVCPDCTGTDCARLRTAERRLKDAGVPGLWVVDDGPNGLPPTSGRPTASH
jgi:hypothetical protein